MIDEIFVKLRQEKYGELDISCYLCSNYTEHIARDCPLLQNKEDIFKLKFKKKKYRSDKEIEEIYNLINKKVLRFRDIETVFFNPKEVGLYSNRNEQSKAKFSEYKKWGVRSETTENLVDNHSENEFVEEETNDYKSSRNSFNIQGNSRNSRTSMLPPHSFPFIT